MEHIADVIVGGGSIAGFATLLYLTLNFLRSSRQDTIEAYSDLYEKEAEKSSKYETRLDALEKEMRSEREQCEKNITELKSQITVLERRILQLSHSARAVIALRHNEKQDQG